MNTGEHLSPRGNHVPDHNSAHNPALTELRSRLTSGMAHLRLNKTGLAGKAGLGRTTVSEALLAGSPVPSAATVTALATALKLPSGELQELRSQAVEFGARPAASGEGPGMPIGAWEPHDLEVHPAGTTLTNNTRTSSRPLPGYIRRAHDQILDNAVKAASTGHSRMVVLVGTSSTGKTRACWEAVQPLAPLGWRLWHPFDPTRAEAALEELHQVQPRTVVWLNEAQHYLGPPGTGERIAAAVHQLLTQPQRGPVLILGTLWHDFDAQYTALPTPGSVDRHSLVRTLLAGRTITMPETFTDTELAAATILADHGDHLLADALTRSRANGRLTQDLAGAPALLERYERASPTAKALLEAAMDARRLGLSLHLPQAFLTAATTDYLNDADYDQLTDDWAEAAYAELACPVHGKQVPLRRVTPRPERRPPVPGYPSSTTAPPLGSPLFRLADYLEQHGRETRRHRCPPASFWHAAHTHLTHPDDVGQLAYEARIRHRLQWAHSLLHRAADLGNRSALYEIAQRLEIIGDRDGAEALVRQEANRGDTVALLRLGGFREGTGDRDGAEALVREAAEQGDAAALFTLAGFREEAGDREAAKTLVRQAAEQGDAAALIQMAGLRKEVGDSDSAEALLRQAAEQGDAAALLQLSAMWEECGDRDDAEALALNAAHRGWPSVLHHLVGMRDAAGDRDGAEALARKAADQGDTSALLHLAELREQAGDQAGAEALAIEAADQGFTFVLLQLAWARENAEEWDRAEALIRQAVDRGNVSALGDLAALRERTGDREGAEALALQAADQGQPNALALLAEMRENAADYASAEVLARRAADYGDTSVYFHHPRRWPHGLDPDGALTPPWQ